MNNRIVGIAGAALLILGIFLPIISFMGIVTISLFNIIVGSVPGGAADPTGTITLFRIVGIVLLLLGIASLLLALKGMYKALIATGVVSLGLLVLIFIKLQSMFSQIPDGGPAGAREMIGGIGTGWGFYVMVLGAIALVVAGIMKSAVPVGNPGWNPPPPPYQPGR